MLTSTSLVLVATLFLLDLVSAVPTKLPLQRRTFKVERVAVGTGTPRSPQKALAKAYGKYNIPMPELTSSSSSSGAVSDVATPNSSSSETGEVGNDPTQYDAEYLSPVTIGGQPIMMDFDTGSSDLWVFNNNMPPSERAGHTNYDPYISKTYTNLKGETFNISYGDGSTAAGFVGTDTVNIGGASVTSQAVELPTSVSGSFVGNTASNGLVGLASSSLNTVTPNQQKTFFDNVSPSLAQPVFTANLKHGQAGTYEFGQIDSSMFQGDITYTSVTGNSGFWMFPSNSFRVGNGSTTTNSEGNPAIADTGTSLLLVDDSVLDGYYNQVQGAAYNNEQGGVTYPCDAALPDLQIALGPSYMGTIPGNMLTFTTVGDGSCFGAMQSNQGQNLQVFGDILFKAMFVVFNNGDNTIGFAPHA